jgi:hypothetical protein
MGANPFLTADDVKVFEFTNFAIALENSFVPSPSVVVCFDTRMHVFDSWFVFTCSELQDDGREDACSHARRAWMRACETRTYAHVHACETHETPELVGSPVAWFTPKTPELDWFLR